MAKKKYLQLPHDYLSHSQMQLWLSDPQRYRDLYFDNRNELRIANMGQQYGKMVATALEENRETGDLLTDSAILLIPKYDTMDKEQRAEFKTPHGWLKIMGRPDTFDSVTHAFRETKTGTHPWTQKKAQSHPQMIFYAVLIWLTTGTKNSDAYLDYIETVVEDGVTKPTGRVESFRVTFAPEDYVSMMARMAKVAHEIEIAWASHITKPWINIF